MRSSVTHPLNVSYLVLGLVFLGISGIWALRTAGVVDTDQLGWLLPLILVGAGAVGIVALAGRSLGRSRRAGSERLDGSPATEDAYGARGLGDTSDLTDHDDTTGGLR